MTINNYQQPVKKFNYKSIRNFLIILLVAQSINTALFIGLDYTQKQLGNYFYQSMTAPFLEKTPSVVLTLNR